MAVSRSSQVELGSGAECQEDQGDGGKGERAEHLVPPEYSTLHLLGGSWVVISGVISRIIIRITNIKGLAIPLLTTHETPSKPQTLILEPKVKVKPPQELDNFDLFLKLTEEGRRERDLMLGLAFFTLP